MTTDTKQITKPTNHTPEAMAVRSASLRNLAVNNKVDAGVLHDAAEMLYDASLELENSRRMAKRLIALRKPCERCSETGKEPYTHKPTDACWQCGGLGELCDAAELLSDARAILNNETCSFGPLPLALGKKVQS